jgi:hypothetical protein
MGELGLRLEALAATGVAFRLAASLMRAGEQKIMQLLAKRRNRCYTSTMGRSGRASPAPGEGKEQKAFETFRAMLETLLGFFI